MPSQKTVVVDHLWDVLSAENRTTATFEDVRKAIGFCNEKHGNTLKADNPANFMKDLLRGGNRRHRPAWGYALRHAVSLQRLR